jgi:hypothetical protein
VIRSTILRSCGENGVIMDYENLMIKARQTVKERYLINMDDDFIPLPLNLMICITTAIAAIQNGIATDDFGPVTEGQAMLEVALKHLEMLIPTLDSQ